MNTWQAARAMAMLVAALFSVLVATEITAFAQRNPSSIQRRVDQLNRQGEQFERDNLGREVIGDKDDRRRSQALIAEVRKDLETLQADYNQIVLAMATNKPVDDSRILHAVEEINHCSTRLKHNLALPEPKEEATKTPETATLPPPTEAPLMRLRKHIYSFVMNPLFETPAVVDVEQSKQASRDLDKIIRLSETISKHHSRKKLSN